MTLDEMFAVLQAAKEGKMIQRQHKAFLDWCDIAEPDWDFVHFNFRVKPEPRTIWMNEYSHGSYAVHCSKDEAEENAQVGRIRRSQWREVIEE